MANPSSAPKKKKNRKVRRNPELLIVNPYDGNKKSRRNKMAKKAKRRNPAKRSRKNPIETIKSFLTGHSADAKKGPISNNVVRALVAGAGGGASMAFGALIAGKRLGETNVAQAVVGIGGGLLGAAILGLAGKKLKQDVLLQAAPLVAAGAVSLSVWELVRDPVVEGLAKLRDSVIGAPAGYGVWENEHAAGYGSWGPEYTKKSTPAGSTLGWLGQNEQVAQDDNPYLSGYGSYEPLGDIYNNQRLGSFESDGSFGEHVAVPECDTMHQQCADAAKAQAGLVATGPAIAGAGYGSYSMMSGFGVQDPFDTLMEPTFAS